MASPNKRKSIILFMSILVFACIIVGHVVEGQTKGNNIQVSSTINVHDNLPQNYVFRRSMKGGKKKKKSKSSHSSTISPSSYVSMVSIIVFLCSIIRGW
ncbi:hypothetical protein RND81_07G189600 [Saponaria officinalis]|uniref:Transmembrane protein n=1 Tax=Saponaria officinalis TaxID=3572 RepID=A0AAW1JTR7_SAPOF